MLGHRFLRRHIQAIKHSAKGFRRTPWTSLFTVFMIIVTLILPLLGWLLMGQLKPLVSSWRQGEVISLYLDASFKMTDKSVVMDSVRSIEGVKKVVFISADESLDALEKQEGMGEIRRYLPENPLPSMIEVMPLHVMDTPQKLDALMQKLKQCPHVEEVRINQDWVSQLHLMLRFITYFTWVLGGAFGMMVVFTIRNLLRLAADAHHDEIQVLKLLGATDAFILRPFLYTGVCLGVLGALGAFFVVHLILSGLGHAVRAFIAPGFGVPLSILFSFNDLGICIFLGVLLGWLGAYLPLKCQLVLIEPCH